MQHPLLTAGVLFSGSFHHRRNPMQNGIDWRRVRRGVLQEARRTGKLDVAERVLTLLPTLIEQCGSASQHRRAIQRIALTLIQNDGAPSVIAPSCPDYAYREGRYTFGGLGNDIALLTRMHVAFLLQVKELVPDMRVQILLADQEADDEELCRSCGIGSDEFRERVERSVVATRESVSVYGWTVSRFTDSVPTIVTDELAETQRLLADPSLRYRLTNDLISRAEMYARINPRMCPEQMFARTARTAAQYVVLGRYAAAQGFLICNHTTTNLSWYGDTGAAVLHNPVSVY